MKKIKIIGKGISDEKAEMYHKERERIRKKHNEVSYNTEIEVQEAKNPKSPLHDHFEWDDKKASHSHRIQQAGELNHLIRIKFINGEKSPALPESIFINSINNKDEEIKGNIPILEITENNDLKQNAIKLYLSKMKPLVDACLYFGNDDKLIKPHFENIIKSIRELKKILK